MRAALAEKLHSSRKVQILAEKSGLKTRLALPDRKRRAGCHMSLGGICT